jgi:hypothetical protein
MEEIPLCGVTILHIPFGETTEVYYASLYSMKTGNFFFEESAFFEFMFSVNMTDPLYNVVLHTKNFFLDCYVVKVSLSIVSVTGDHVVLVPQLSHMTLEEENDGIQFMIDLTEKKNDMAHHVFSCGSVNSVIHLIIELDMRNIFDMPCQLKSFMYDKGYVLHT